MSKIDDIKKIALSSVLEGDDEAFIRHLFRWYSKTFFTPLAEVELLPLEYILLHYFETQYEELDSTDKHNLIIHLLESPQEREARKKQEALNEELFLKEVEAEAVLQSKDPEEYKRQQIALRKKGLKKPELPKPEEPIETKVVDFNE